MQTGLFCQDTPLKTCKEIDKSGVATGYVGKAEASRSAFDAEGYFCTGDIVQMAPVVANTGLEGQPFQPEMAWAYRLTVIDRKSNMLKLAAGEFVAPQELEQFKSQLTLGFAGFLILGGVVSLLVGGSLWEAKDVNADGTPPESDPAFGFVPKSVNVPPPAQGEAPSWAS